MLSFTTSVFASESKITKKNGFEMETIDDTKEHQKIKFTNLETGEVEYVESILENGKYVYFSTNDEGKQKIESVNGTIKITDQETKEVKYLKPIKSTIKDDIKVEDASSLAAAWWEQVNMYRSSYAIDTAKLSLVAGILASIYGGPVTGVITSIASYLISINAPNVWYIVRQYQDQYDLNHWMDETYYYADPNYSNFRGVEDRIYYTDYNY